jgi:sarcosine oxidase subunit beta
MKRNFDIAIVGGGIIGMATAHYLVKDNPKIVVIERDYIGSGSTGRCISGIRQQFSNSTAIRLMKENIEIFSNMEEEFGFSIEFLQNGYLLLAHDEKMDSVFKENIRIQSKEGVDVSLITPSEIHKLVPHLNVQDVISGAYCPDDGQAYPFAILKGYRQTINEKGGEFIPYNPVIGIKKDVHFLLTLENGLEIEAEKVLLCAGPWTKELAAKVGLDLPLFPERHEAVITERMPKFLGPMIVDYRSDGCYFQQLLTGQIIGCYTPIPNFPGICQDTSFEFLPQMAWRMTRLVPALRNSSVLRQWAGCYTMTPDGNPILDESDIPGLYIGSGMCGHGFMFGPAMGKHLAYFISNGDWDMDFSDFAINRSFQDASEQLK